MLKIITYNIYYGDKLSEIYFWIETLKKKPDIICFQEFPYKDLRTLKKQRFIEGMDFKFSPGLERETERFGQITIYNKNKLEFVDKKTIKLGVDYLEKFYKKSPNKRTALLTRFKYNNNIFVLVNVHLSAISLNSKRLDQLSKVLRHLEKVPTIVLGDFNYSSLWRRDGLIRFMQKFEFSVAGEKMITNRYKKRVSQQLDYVFYHKFFLQEIFVERIDLSDHYPVFVKMRPQK